MMPLRHCWYSLGSISRLLSSSKRRSRPKGDSHGKTHSHADDRHIRSGLRRDTGKGSGDSDEPAMMQHSEEAQNQGDEEGTRMMGHGMMRQCMRQCMAEDGMMGEGWRKHGMMRHGGMMGPLPMRIIFALMDRDSDGTVSLEEFQAAHERIFKAMDPDKG